MSVMARFGWLGLAGFVLLVAPGCDSEGTGPEDEGVPEGELTFVRFSASVLARVERQGSFWAVRGENRELVLRYAPERPDEVGKEFLEFEVPGNALLRRPDGTPFEPGDSVLITVQVASGDRFLFEFEPSGLVFDPEHPAEIEVNYEEADHDLNGDGLLNSADDLLELRLRIWRQEQSGDPWFPITSLRIREDEIRADIASFTGFALAS